MPDELRFYWRTYHQIVAGPAVRDLGAGPAVWSGLERRLHPELFLRLVEAVNVIDSEHNAVAMEASRPEPSQLGRGRGNVVPYRRAS